MRHVRADDLHMHKEILGQCMRDAPTNNIQVACLVRHKVTSVIKCFGINLPEGEANVVNDRVREPVQKMFRRCSICPCIVFSYWAFARNSSRSSA